jgi:hypothetical protein
MRFGVKASRTDAHVMAALDVELLEVHMGLDDPTRYRNDLVGTFKDVRRKWGHDLVVHAPEFMRVTGTSLLVDPSSADRPLRDMSVRLLGSTLHIAGELEAETVVMHPGGILPSKDDPRAGGGISRLEESMSGLRDIAREQGVQITLENMPWFYIKKAQEGGADQCWESTILVWPEDADVLLGFVDGLTLDVSHGYLHTPTGGMEAIEAFVRDHGDHIVHLHLSDALPPHHEGLQIGEGNVDLPWVLTCFKGRDITAVPEILGGHMGGGLSFRRALEELRAIEASL